MLLRSSIVALCLAQVVIGSQFEIKKRQTITIAHQFEVVDESNFPDGSDALKGIAPASGTDRVTPHMFQSDCAQLRAVPPDKISSYMSLAQSSCGLPYEAMKMRDSSKTFCSGMAASNLAIGHGGGCGACIKLSYNGRQTFVRIVSNHGGGTSGGDESGFDISFDNYKELANPADYAQASPDGSGAGSDPLQGVAYEEVDGSKCNLYWDGRCLPNIYAGISAASTHWDYGCS